MLQAFVPQAQSQECGPHPPPKGQLSATWASCQGTASGLRVYQNYPLGKTACGGIAPPKTPLLPPVS